MRFALATNFDNRLIKEVARFGTVDTVYGKLNYDIVGGGRISFLMPRITYKQLKGHILCCHDNGIKFNYLLNARCLGGRELTSENKKIFRFIDKIIKTNVDSVTVANIGLLMMLRERYPELSVDTSMFCNIHTLPQLQNLIRSGVHSITLSPQINRDFSLLGKMVAMTPPGVRLRLIANNICVFNCMTVQEHAILVAHRSRADKVSPAYSIDPYLLNCSLLRVIHPVKLISSRWIRPEDVPYYDELGKGKIMIKIVDRSFPTNWLIRTMKAYSEQSYNGNLLDLIRYEGKFPHIDKGAILRGALKGNFGGKDIRQFVQALKQIPVYIDNKKLTGFLNKARTIDCSGRICNDRGWGTATQENEGCTFCRSWAEKALHFDENARKEYVEKIIAFQKSLNRGKRL